MMLPLALLAVLGLVAAVVAVGLLIAWHPKAPDEPAEPLTLRIEGVDVTFPVLDFCEHTEGEGDDRHTCGAPATHELVGEITVHAGGMGRSAMVACYCAEHAPVGAGRVRD
jgi:hypothetical protein